jgi:hypothetical protein
MVSSSEAKKGGSRKNAKAAIGPKAGKGAAPASTELLPPPVAEHVIDAVYEEIQHLHRDATLDLWNRIGALIVERFYGGELAAWRERGPKDASFRKLAARFDDSDISASRLSRMVGVHELTQRLGVASLQHLSTTHLSALLGLPEADQKRLIEQATEKSLTTRELRDKAVAARKKASDGRGRPPLPAFVKTINLLGRLVDDEDHAFGDLDQVDELDEEESTRLYQAVTGMKLRCEKLQKALESRTTGFRK